MPSGLPPAHARATGSPGGGQARKPFEDATTFSNDFFVKIGIRVYLGVLVRKDGAASGAPGGKEQGRGESFPSLG